MLGESDAITSGQEDRAGEIEMPDACVAGEVDSIGGWVITHKGAGTVRGPEPGSQRGEEALPNAAEDLREDQVPGGPVSSRRVFNWPEEGAGRLGGKSDIKRRV